MQRDGQLYIRNKSDDVGKYDLYMAGHGRAATQGSFVFRIDENNNANESFYITNGTGGTIARINEVGNTVFNVWVNAVGFNSTSDLRYKKDISPLSSSLDNINRIRGVRYNWDQNAHPEKSFGDQPQIGFIAQELEQVYPELVHTNEEGYKSVAYDKMTAVLVEAVKELKTENNVLVLQNEKLMQLISQMDSRLNQLEQIGLIKK